MVVNLTQAKQILERYIEAEQAVLDGRTVQFGSRSLTMVDLGEIRKGRQEWERKVNSLQRAGRGHPAYKLAEF